MMVLLFCGSGGRIRTHVLSESESDALPLGDTRMFSTLPILARMILFIKITKKLYPLTLGYSTFCLLGNEAIKYQELRLRAVYFFVPNDSFTNFESL